MFSNKTFQRNKKKKIEINEQTSRHLSSIIFFRESDFTVIQWHDKKGGKVHKKVPIFYIRLYGTGLPFL